MIKKRLYFMLAAATLIFITGNKGIAAAAPKQVLTMTPTSANQVIDPGAVKTGNFQIVNQGETTYNFKVYAAPYSVTGEEYDPNFTPLPGKPDVASWLQFSIAEAAIKPGQAITVNYKITVPRDALPGGYYAVAFAQTKQPKLEAGITLIQRVGHVFYLQVAGPASQKGSLVSWQSPFLQKSPLIAVVRLKNEGSLHYSSDINISVKDIFGHPKYTLKAQKVILPQTIRKITATWEKAPSIGLFKVDGSVTVLGKSQPLPTKYVLVLSQTARLALLAGVVGLVLLLILRRVLRAAKRRRKAKKSKTPPATPES
jgi:hypothetical protein